MDAAVPGPDEAAALDAGSIPDSGDASVLAAELPVAVGQSPDLAAGQDASAEPVSLEEASSGPPLGAIGYDSEGNQGRIHIVVSADTLWDISDAYLGTPWVWPSIWQDNRRQVENPHLIHPGDRIWITAHRDAPDQRPRRRTRCSPTVSPTQPEAPVRDLRRQGRDPRSPNPHADFEPVPCRHAGLAAGPAQPQGECSRECGAGLRRSRWPRPRASWARSPSAMLLSPGGPCSTSVSARATSELGDQFTVFRTREKVYDPDTGAAARLPRRDPGLGGGRRELRRDRRCAVVPHVDLGTSRLGIA